MAKNKAAEVPGKKDAEAKQKKTTKSASKDKKPGIFTRIRNYFRDVRLELKRVVWPTRSEVINSSIIVVATLVFFVVFILIVGGIIEPLLTAFSKLG